MQGDHQGPNSGDGVRLGPPYHAVLTPSPPHSVYFALVDSTPR